MSREPETEAEWQRRHDEALLKMLKLATAISVRYHVCLPCLVFNCAEITSTSLDEGCIRHGVPGHDWMATDEGAETVQ